MTKKIMLTNRCGERIRFDVQDAEQVLGAFRYLVAGDECMVLGFPESVSILLESGEEGQHLNSEITDVEFLTPADIPWEGTVHDA